jgi:hypothetical protein
VSPLPTPALCGHPRRFAPISGTAAPSPALWEPDTTRHHHPRRCTSTGLLPATPSNQRTDGDPSRRRPHGHPRSRSRASRRFTMTLAGGEIHQDDHQLHGAVRHTCTFSAFTTILALRLNQTSGTWRLRLLSRHACSPPLQAPRCNATQCLERNPAGRTTRGRNQDKTRVIVLLSAGH